MNGWGLVLLYVITGVSFLCAGALGWLVVCYTQAAREVVRLQAELEEIDRRLTKEEARLRAVSTR